ncbi:DAK2 domain-containing protein [Streptomyces lonarensis]|uniref:DAK2 domain-containing protein n=1 Tax=Streptomyces lonarensis TaxID=700599 RepID=A0A7X6CY13_9ACTN|nr:DAK2 domain-containing protein [Streptomyces lonarensis]NJQ04525.1 DAK2 domain-containing protein [Streptomyces lonarensis]
MPRPLDAAAIRRWCRFALEDLGQARESIDAINVYPVADGDTGTNLYLTVESAAQAVEAAAGGDPTLAEAAQAMAHGALIGAHGNSGTILAELLRGVGNVLAVADEPVRPADLARALRAASDAAYRAVARPVEGTILSVAAAAADAAETAGARASVTLPDVTAAANASAREALAATPGQLQVLAAAGVVDAGGRGLVAVLAALDAAVGGRAPSRRPHHGLGRDANPHGAVPRAHDAARGAGRSSGAAPARPAGDTGRRRHDEAGARPEVPETGLPPGAAPRASCCLGEPSHGAGPVRRLADCPESPATGDVTAVAGGTPRTATGAGASGPVQDPRGPSHEVIYLLEADQAALDLLRPRLEKLGDSLVIVGGDGLWNVHIHTDDPGAAVEVGVEAGRPHRIRVTHLGGRTPGSAPRAPRAVLGVVPGPGLASLCHEAGAQTLIVHGHELPGSGELAAAILRAHAEEVVLLPNDDRLRHAAAAAAAQARGEGVRVAVLPTRSPVQGLAALAVHTPGRTFDEDVVAMTAAAGATRFGELSVATGEAWTTAGICQAGDVLGLIDSDIAVIGRDLAEVALTVVERMLAAGGELVTLVPGAGAPPDLADRIERRVRRSSLAVDTVVYHGHQASPLLIGVE